MGRMGRSDSAQPIRRGQPMRVLGIDVGFGGAADVIDFAATPQSSSPSSIFRRLAPMRNGASMQLSYPLGLNLSVLISPVLNAPAVCRSKEFLPRFDTAERPAQSRRSSRAPKSR